MRPTRWTAFLIIPGLVCGGVLLAQTFGVKKKMPRPNEFGNVIINNYSEAEKKAPVLFQHWLHRAKYTCRLCHVDLGFAMTAGGTDIKEADLRHGLYCGACHDGKTAFAPEVLTAKGKVKQENCDLCHSVGKEIEFENDFYEFTKGFPRSRFGNKIDWMAAEDQGLIELSDYLEGVSIKRKPLASPEDGKIEASAIQMPDIIFSHEKHAVWNGCELCHPQIYGVKAGGTKVEMQEIFDGKYCGACHGKVAFMNLDCQLCHTEDVY